MPWCQECDRYLTPNSMNPDGTCPSCGRVLEAPAPLGGGVNPVGEPDTVVDEDHVKAPWHFWLMIVGVVIYLGWRLLQGISWGIDHWL